MPVRPTPSIVDSPKGQDVDIKSVGVVTYATRLEKYADELEAAMTGCYDVKE